MTATTKLSDSAREDLARRIAASKLACDAALARGDYGAADRLWAYHIGLLEVEMGRTSSAEKLTMTPSPPAER